MLDPIKNNVVILQKSIHYTPAQKLIDALIAVLAGAHGLAEINTRVRSDAALQRAFGRTGCAEQSVVQETLNACTELNIQQMQHALNLIFRGHSAAYRHNYRERLQLLDLDMSGLPCGPRQEGSGKGYFGENNIRSGRQLGRVVAAHSEEVVVDQLFPGNVQLNTALQPLVMAAEETLSLDQQRRQRTVLRVDAGGGSLANVNWCLERGYHFHGKAFTPHGAEALAATVKEWFSDPQQSDREVGWITAGDPDYVRPVRRLAIRWCKRKGGWHHAVLLSTLAPKEVSDLLNLPADRATHGSSAALAYAKLYDKRGGTVEVEIKESKQGVGITKRSKKKFAAQQMVMLLGQLAHNMMIWARKWLSADAPRLARFGALRLARDLFTISGSVHSDRKGAVIHIVLNKNVVLAQRCVKALSKLLRGQKIKVELGVT